MNREKIRENKPKVRSQEARDHFEVFINLKLQLSDKKSQ